jgi:hypothetical protein
MSDSTNYTQQEAPNNETIDTTANKNKKTDYKMVKVNNEVHKKLKMKSVETGFSMQEIAEEGIMNKLNNM